MAFVLETALVGACFWIREHNAERRLSEELRRRRRQGTWPKAVAAAPTETDDHGKHRFVRVTLEWRNVECRLTTVDKKTKEKRIRKILTRMRGRADPGRLTCIMGPSGSGKTTLLNVLAQQVPKCESMQLVGRVNINGRPVGMSRHLLSYVRQEDLFYSQLTVRETLRLAAALRLPKTLSRKRKEAYVDELLNKLGLLKAADTIVGDEKVRGISGGERKRLSLGCELVSGPSLILADEPTTGLDSFQAERVMATMRRLAHDGHTVICTIHQPSSSIFRMFDDLLLLSEGEVVYHGPARDALAYFESCGLPCPEHTNPAEFFADLISIDYSTAESLSESRGRVRRLTQAWARRIASAQARDDEKDAEEDGEDEQDADAGGMGWALAARAAKEDGSRPDWWEQFQLLLTRSWRQATRDKAATVVRTLISVVSAAIFGSIYFQLGVSQASIQSRLGLFQMAAVSTAMSALSKTLNLFVRERAIVQQDRAKGAYGVAAYFFSKLVAELPTAAIAPLTFASLLYPLAGLHPSLTRFLKFLVIHALESFTSSAVSMTIGALAPSQDAALAMGPPVYLIFILFGGYTVSSATVPWLFRWVPNVSLMRWAFEGMSVNDLRGLEFECRKPGDTCDGDEVLERLGYADSTLTGALLANLRIMLFCYAATYSILSHRTPAFQATLRKDPNPELMGPRLEEVSEEEARRIAEQARVLAAAAAAARAADEEVARLTAEKEALRSAMAEVATQKAQKEQEEKAAAEAAEAAIEAAAAAAVVAEASAPSGGQRKGSGKEAKLKTEADGDARTKEAAELARKLEQRRAWESKGSEDTAKVEAAKAAKDREREAVAAAKAAREQQSEKDREAAVLEAAKKAMEKVESKTRDGREQKLESQLAAACARRDAAHTTLITAGHPVEQPTPKSAAKAIFEHRSTGRGGSPSGTGVGLGVALSGSEEGLSHSISSDSLLDALSAPIPASPSPGPSPISSPAASFRSNLNPCAPVFTPAFIKTAPVALDGAPGTTPSAAKPQSGNSSNP